jgi:hypothetical protein
MATSLGTVQAVAGKFYAQDANGNIRVLKVGDTISQGEKVFGDTSNTLNNTLEILSNTQESLSLTGTNSLVFDMSTNEATFGNEEVAFSPNSAWMPTQNAEIPTDGQEVAQTNAGDITEEETAAGNEAVSSSDTGVFSFDNRDGDAVNIKADLRNTSFPEDEVDPTDNGDKPYSVSIDFSGLNVNEDDLNALFTLNLSTQTLSDATLVVNIEGVDYTYTIPSGVTSFEIPYETKDSDVYIDPDTVTATIISLTGGGFDNVTINNPTVTISITDTIDTTEAILTSTGDGDEDNGSVTYTVTVPQETPPQGDQEFTITLSNGQTETIVIPAGQNSGSITLAWGNQSTSDTISLEGYPNSDVYSETDFILDVTNVQIVGNGGNYEDLIVTDNSSNVVIEDSIDTTYVSISGLDVNEDEATTTFTIKLSNPTDENSPAVITVNVGGINYEVTVPALSDTTTLIVPTRDSDIYLDSGTLTAKVINVSGGNFEAVDYVSAQTTINISDTIDEVMVVLSATGATEAGQVEYTATLYKVDENGNITNETAKANNKITVTLEGGRTIEIAAGSSSGSIKDVSQGDDYVIDTETLSVAITGVSEENAGSAGALENLTYDDTVVTPVISDTIDTLYVKLISSDTTHEGGVLTHTVQLVDENGHPYTVPLGEMVTVNLSYVYNNGLSNSDFENNTVVESVNIIGGTSEITFTNQTIYNTANENDESYTLSINTVSQSANVIEFENIVPHTTENSVTGTIIDYDKLVYEDNKNTQESGNFNVVLFEATDAIFINDENNGDTYESITISGIPDDAILKYSNGTVISVSNGEVTLTDDLDTIKGITITPATDSSTDINLSYTVTSTDGSGSYNDTFAQRITIKPWADKPYTLDSLGAEQITYDAVEDQDFFSLNLNSSNVTIGETNPDHADEIVRFVRFSGEGLGYNIPDGSILQYEDSNGNTKTFTFDSSLKNNYVNVNANNLDTIKFKAAADFNGEINIKMQVFIKDVDADSYDNTTSQSDGTADKLTITVSGSADAAVVSAVGGAGLEDAGRDENTGVLDGSSGIAIELDAYTNFGSEDIEFIISDIPADAYILDKDGNPLATNTEVVESVDSNGNIITHAVGTVVVVSLADAEGISVVPPHDSNVDFNLTVVAKTTESNYDANNGGNEVNYSLPQELTIQLTGVIDAPVISINTIGGNEDEWISFGLNVTTGEDTGDGSETLYATLENIPSDAQIRIVDSNGNDLGMLDSLTLAGVNSDGSTNWRIDSDLLAELNAGTKDFQIKAATDFSGEIKIGMEVTAIENDGDRTSVRNDFIININPVVDTSGGNMTQTVLEDTWTALNLPWSVGDTTGSESITSANIVIPDNIEVKVNGVLISNDGSAITLNLEDTVEIIAPLHSNVDFNGIVFTREIKDDSTHDSNLDANSEVATKTVVTNISIDMKGVADGWDIDSNNDGVIDENDGDYDGFKVQDITIVDNNETTPLSAVITQNVTVEDNEAPGDNSEAEYYIIQNNDTNNTSWSIEGGINAGNGTWIVSSEALAIAEITIHSLTDGDGILDLKIIPVTKENDGDVKFDAEHPFSIAYGDGATYSGTGASSSDTVTVDVTSSIGNGEEDSSTITGTDFDATVTASQTGTISTAYVINGVEHGSLTSTSGFYVLPGGVLVTTDVSLIDDVTPDSNYNGALNIDVTVVATNTTTGTEGSSDHTIVVDIAPVIDTPTTSASGGSETDGESIHLNLSIASGDGDGSESIVGDVTITPTEGSLSGTGVIDNGDGSYTVSSANLSNVEFTPPSYEHGSYSFDVSYTWQDSDGFGTDDTVMTSVNQSFTINLASHVDAVSIAINPTETVVLEGQELPLGLELTQADSDGSEIASVIISGLPEGAVLSIGTMRTLDDSSREFILKGSEVANAKVIADPYYSGEFTVTAKAYSYDIASKEISESATVSKSFSITPVASDLTVQADGFGGKEGEAISIKLDLVLEDIDVYSDSSETVNVTFTNYEAGSVFTINGIDAIGSDDGNGNYVITGLTPAQAEALAIIPPAYFDGKMENIQVAVQTVDGTNVLAAAVTDTFDIQVDAVTDAATLTVNDTTATRTTDTNDFMLDIDVSVPDSDQDLSVILTGVQGTLNNGTYDSSSDSWTLSQYDLVGLKLTPNSDVTDNFDISVKAVTQDGNDVELETASEIISVVVNVDETFSLPTDGSVIDGFAGYDTLNLAQNQDIDFSSIGNIVKNIEEIDLSVEGENEITNLSARDVFDMTDENNEIKISGTSEDKVNLSNEWSSKGTESGFDIYEATINVDGQDQTIKLEIKTEIQDI